MYSQIRSVIEQAKSPVERFDDGREMVRLYELAKKIPVGGLVQCPSCHNLHIKTTYHKVFCSNSATHPGGNCKDYYWNMIGNAK